MIQNKIKVTIFDDNHLLRISLSEIINDSECCTVVSHYAHTIDAIEHIIVDEPDVIIMDINMPEENGIAATRRIKAEFPNIQILMQTVFDDDANVFDAIASGANGYILKNITGESLIQSIVDIHNGGSAMSPNIARKVLSYLQQQKIEQTNYKLTTREKEVLEYLVYGLPYKQIADKMNITYDTVRAHMKKIYEKLHVSSMTEAVVKAIKYKLF
ncbi:MAG: response regulator transcription factor [Chitinophagaceae bacterium]|nr:response regulator transcription factor [Chitinophagaceae bacterium]